MGAARIIDENVDVAKRLYRFGHDTRRRARSGDIRGDSQYGYAGAGSDFLDCGLQAIFPARRDNDLRAVLGEFPRRRLPDPDTAAGDESDLVDNSQIHSSIPQPFGEPDAVHCGAG